MKNGRACLVIDLSVSFGICFYRNEVNEKNPDGGPRRSSLQRSATLPANPRNNPILRHHQRYHQDESDQQIILQRPGHYPQLHQKIRIRVRSTSTDKGGEINNNNQNHVSIVDIQCCCWFMRDGHHSAINLSRHMVPNEVHFQSMCSQF